MKKMFSLLLILLLITPVLGSTTYASNTVNAKVTESSTYFNGEQKSLNGFNISNNNYFRLRDLAEYFTGTTSQFDISWNKENNAIEIITGQAYTPEETDGGNYYSRNRNYSASLSTSKVLVNGQLQLITAYNIDGNNYFQLRDLASKIPFDIEYDNESNRISLFSQTSDHTYRVKTAFEAKNNEESSYFPRWKSTVASYLVNNNDGTVSVIEANEDVTIETYNEQYELSGNKSIPYELPLFGGFYSGEKYNYIAFGQDNREEDDNKEVIRIVRYDKSFNRIDSVSIKGGESYTVEPFDAGAGRMAEAGDTLVFHTSRTRYTTEDKLNHQSQLTIIVNTKTMTVTNDMGKFQENHVSHSFDQYVLFDGSNHVLVDHGDAYPRSIVLNKANGTSYSEVDLFDIPGKIGANTTGVSIGGFEMSAANYIVAMNTIDHSLVKEYTSYEMVGLEKDQRDIILNVLPKTSTAVNHITLAKYVGTNLIASIPKLVKISDNKMMVLWQEFDKDNHPGDLKYVLIDGNGKAIGDIQTKDFVLSECSPIISGNKIIWYTNSNGNRLFYSIPLN
ncbi:hypothetical protein EJP82_15415 [Paenibacillus anaericanus]|uniref:Copper amine oxidase-like N-terminal domain-containing protein n=1 Tax=Paenibacillus anaericanus TaxID=170367 RepID=A0A433Y7J2_9BACL|nr:hypothetical protein [Paenibacillus anaericanus]RUT45348.1 hypothetical protein EJP82_15415 [Paenibacillus anaericanus]